MSEPRVVVITGAAQGIGAAYAEAFGAAGWKVALVDRADCRASAELTRSSGAAATLSVAVDISRHEETERMAAQVLDSFGQIDVLVNNAGLFWGLRHATMEEIPIEEWDRCFAVNVRGTWLATRAVVPAMRARHYGRIINTSSMTVLDGVPGYLHYVSSKAAIIGMTRALARELGPDGITVNTISPDLIVHPDAAPDAATLEAQEHLREARALQRDLVPADLLGTVMYLSGDGAAAVTGQNIYVNGGRIFS